MKCTLVNISFRDSGYQKIASWTEPFVKAFEGDKAVNCVKVSVSSMIQSSILFVSVGGNSSHALFVAPFI